MVFFILVDAQGLLRHLAKFAPLRGKPALFCLFATVRTLFSQGSNPNIKQKIKRPIRVVKFFGGRAGIRTLDPLIKSQLLYQLSYASKTQNCIDYIIKSNKIKFLSISLNNSLDYTPWYPYEFQSATGLGQPCQTFQLYRFSGQPSLCVRGAQSSNPCVHKPSSNHQHAG